MVRTTLCLDDIHSLPFTQLAQNFAYNTLFLTIENLATIFEGKYYMIFAVPFGMS